jgi:hypothetical protein
VTRSDSDKFKSAREYKSIARAKIFEGGKFTLIANIGDQQSDLAQEPGINEGSAECTFKLPNPFYFIE